MNLKPRLVKTAADLTRIGQQLKAEALDCPRNEKGDYTIDDLKSFVEEAREKRVERIRNGGPPIGDLNAAAAIFINGHYVSLCLSFDKYAENEEIVDHHWHLSFTEILPEKEENALGNVQKTAVVPDGPAKFIAEGILGGHCTEIPSPALVIKTIRHFVREAE